MSPSGCLCLLTIFGLILPTRGQTSKEATSTSLADPTTEEIRVQTEAPGTDYTELQPTPQTSTLPAGGGCMDHGATHISMSISVTSSFFLHTEPQG
uniref:FXYD domain containing ion transport regulator 5 n=1 Tax=Equus asinus TaxID=9793 RepID=A0A8C4PUQ2_EQUAS